MIDADGKKKCPRCGELKLAEGNFYRLARVDGDGFGGYCIPCTKSGAVEWQKANPEKKAMADRKESQKPVRRAQHAERGRLRRLEHPEKARAATSAWQKANPGKVRAKAARHRAKNPAAVSAAQAKYHASDRSKSIHADRERLRRAVMKQERYRANGTLETVNSLECEGKFTIREWAAVLKAFEHACAYCGSQDRMTIEHLTPLSRGGQNVVGNIAPACSPCNTSKNAKTVEEFAPERAADIRDRASLH